MSNSNTLISFKYKCFYSIRQFIPRPLQLSLRRLVAQSIKQNYSDIWPIDKTAGKDHKRWVGWPNGKKFALILTHDIETKKGIDNCNNLMDLETKLRISSTFNLVPERYPIPEGLIDRIKERGFGIGVHGLYHDGKLFRSYKIFEQRSVHINEYLRKWQTRGFSSPSMHHKLDWMYLLDIDYATSTFDTDPFEPQPDGIGTIFPLIVENTVTAHRYVELPYTLPQDSTLFIILKEPDTSIWKAKIDWIAQNGGMALLNTHPDYMYFNSNGCRDSQQYPADNYINFLKYVKKHYQDVVWIATPTEVAQWTIKAAHQFKKEANIFRINLSNKSNRSQTKTEQTLSLSKNHKRSRACMVAYTFYEGDNRVRRYAETLVTEGWDVDAFVLQSPNRPATYSIHGVNVYGIQHRTHNEKRAVTYLNRLIKFLFRSSWHLTQHHFKKPYDLVHIHSIPDFEVIAGLIPKMFGAKVILDIHDIVPELFLNKFMKAKDSKIFKLLLFVERISCALANHVIIANHIWYKRLIERSVSPQKCSVVMNFPDSKFFGPHQRARINDNDFHMLYPGTLSRHQGIDTAIEAVSILRNTALNLKFNIYGSGTDELLLREMTKRLNLEDRVFFHQPVSIEEIADVMVNADLGVEPKIHSSFSDEAFSTKILEFMMLGIPIVASDTTVHKYYISEDSVRYFKAGNAYDLSNAILEMYENEYIRKKCIRNGSEVIKDFIWEDKKSSYLDIVSNLTNVNF